MLESSKEAELLKGGFVSYGNPETACLTLIKLCRLTYCSSLLGARHPQPQVSDIHIPLKQKFDFDTPLLPLVTSFCKRG